jgi:hypothetical protein
MEEEGELRDLITNFYKDLFRSSAGTRFDELLDQVQPKVSPLMNDFCCGISLMRK